MLNRRLPRLLLMAALAMLPALSHALACMPADGSTNPMITESIGSTVAVPVTEASNKAIWHSSPRSVSVNCYKDHDGLRDAENVYFYPNPRGDGVPQGVQFGVVYNNVTYYQTQKIDTGKRIPACPKPTAIGNCPKVRVDLNFTVEIATKTPYPPSGSVGKNEFQVLQFDGVGGINDRPNSNVVYKLVGLSNIRFIQCAVEVRLDPASNTLDFGRIVKSTKGLVPTLPRKDFRLNLVKTCDDPVKINGFFTGKNGSNDTYTATLVKKKDGSDSGLGLQLFFSDGRQIPFGRTEFLADFKLGDRQKTVPMYGTIVPTNMGKVEEGPFQGTVNIDLDYI